MLHAFRLFGSLGMERLLEVFFGKKSAFRLQVLVRNKETTLEDPGSFWLHGGDDGDRTHDLSIANAALSQLSYVPMVLKRNAGKKPRISSFNIVRKQSFLSNDCVDKIDEHLASLHVA